MTKLLTYLQKLLPLVLLLCAGLGAGLLAPGQAQVGETITYIHADIAGSPIAATNAAGSLLWKESYRPYGARSQNTDQGKQAQWFTGKSLEASTGLSYFGARYYDPVVGRFMGVDPVGFMENNLHSFNRYAYGNNNPSRYLDPDGNLPVLIPLAAYVFGNAAIGAGFDYAFQKAMGHTVNWGQVAFGGFVGGMLGGAGGVGASAVMNSAKATSQVVNSTAIAASKGVVPNLGRKLEYFLGNATGNLHNVDRSTGMLRQLESVGLGDGAATRQYLTDHLTGVVNDASNIVLNQTNGRVVRESILMGPTGSLKFESVWEGDKLITGTLLGGR
jgi:RHS repeat-associated protein